MTNFADRTIRPRDDLDIPRGLNSASVDLIHLDPPFDSNRDHAVTVLTAATAKESLQLEPAVNLCHQPLKQFIPAEQSLATLTGEEPLERVKSLMANGDGEAEYSVLPIRNPSNSSYSGYCVTFRGIYQAEERDNGPRAAADAQIAIPSYHEDDHLELARYDLQQFVAVPIVDEHDQLVGIVSSSDVISQLL